MERQSISLKSSKEEKIRGLCSVLFDNVSRIQLGTEVNCRVVIIANNSKQHSASVLEM